MMRFTIRDVLWLTVVVALAVGWGVQTFRLEESQSSAQRAIEELDKHRSPDWQRRAIVLGNYCSAHDLYVEWESKGFRITKRQGLESIWVPDEPPH